MIPKSSQNKTLLCLCSNFFLLSLKILVYLRNLQDFVSTMFDYLYINLT